MNSFKISALLLLSVFSVSAVPHSILNFMMNHRIFSVWAANRTLDQKQKRHCQMVASEERKATKELKDEGYETPKRPARKSCKDSDPRDYIRVRKGNAIYDEFGDKIYDILTLELREDPQQSTWV